jgi:hypothetical protein
MKEFETIIIGGGISGLSCGRKLQDSDKDFLLITKDLGGRMLSSKNFGVDYGAAYVTSDYTNVLKYVEKQERFRLRDFYFFDGFNFSNVFSYKNIKHFPKMVKFLFILKSLERNLLKYRKQAPNKTVKECFTENKVLNKYWKMSAKDFIKDNGLEELDELYGNPITATTAFVESDKVNAAYYIGMFFCAVLPTWTVNFRHTVKKLSKGFENKIKIASVLKVKKQKSGKFKVHTSRGDFLTKNIVFAAPEKSLSKVYNIPKPNLQQPAYTFHVVGTRRDIYQDKKAVCFRPKNHDIYMIWKQKSGADLIYSKNSRPNFKEYYERYHVIKKVHWQPGMIIPKHDLIDQNLEKNVYLASDYNLSLMEDSFLTGLYAANQIIKS